MPSTTRLPILVLLALGVLLAFAAIAEFWVGQKASNVSNLVRPELTDSGLAQHRSDFEEASTGFTGLRDRVLPAIADELGIPRDQFQAQVATNYPDVGKLLAQEDQIVPFAEASLVNLERQQNNYERADSLPVSWLPWYSSALIDLAAAAVLVVAAITLLKTSSPASRTIALAAAGVAFVILIAFPLIAGVPGKASSAQTVLDSLNPSTSVVVRTQQSIATAEAAQREFQQRLAPDLAAALGLSPAAFNAALAQQFPAEAKALNDAPAVLGRYDTRLAIRVGGAADLRTLKKLPLGPLGWFDPAFGVVVAAVVGWCVVSAGQPAASKELSGSSPASV